MQTPGVEPAVDDAVDDVELDDFEPEAEEGEEVADLGEDTGEEPGGEDETRQAPPQPRRPGREERRRAELRELRERVERQDRELARVQGQVQQQPRVDPAELARREQLEREQVQLLAPEQQIEYWRRKDRQEFQQTLFNHQIQIGETIDKRDWDAACRTDTVRSRFADRVEDVLRTERNAGRNPTRETVFKYLYGEAALQQRQRQGDRQRRNGAARVRAQTTQPAGGRSDVAADRRTRDDDSIEAARRRISGRPLW
jgi:hypothetical protein